MRFPTNTRAEPKAAQEEGTAGHHATQAALFRGIGIFSNERYLLNKLGKVMPGRDSLVMCHQQG